MENQLIANHKNEGRFIHVDDTIAFIYDKGQGEPVICFHGVPASSFLYRKMIDELALNGLRGISFDLIGMGLSDRPENFDYSWTGLGNWAHKVIEKLNVGKFHVVLHDIGGPVGCEVIAKMPEQILSVTILNTLIVNLPQFKKPFPMQYYEKRGIGELIVSLTNAFFFKQLMYLRGVNKREEFGIQEADAYVKFLNGNDKARAFLKIMRSFEATQEKEDLYLNAIKRLNVAKQIIWGDKDTGLTLKQYGEPLKRELRLDTILKVPGAHFLQEDNYETISNEIVKLTQVRLS